MLRWCKTEKDQNLFEDILENLFLLLLGSYVIGNKFHFPIKGYFFGYLSSTSIQTYLLF